jgi:hypothetical protein
MKNDWVTFQLKELKRKIHLIYPWNFQPRKRIKEVGII